MRNTLSVPLLACSELEKSSSDLAWAVRARLDAPWPLSVSSGVAAEPFDLKRFAGAGEGHSVVVDDGFTHGFGHGLLENECGADHVLVRQRGCVRGGAHV